MKKVTSTLALIVLLVSTVYSQSIEQHLAIVANSQTVGGTFSVAVQVKGTDLNLLTAQTLGSATIDINYDNTKLTFLGAELTSWAFGASQGYSRSAMDIVGTPHYIRIAIAGATVGADAPGIPAGYEIGDTYATWVQLNFEITDATGSPALLIKPGSNAVGIFQNGSNNPKNGVINNQPLTAPEVDDAPLPVELSTFTAKQDGEKVMLSWQTKTEVNNYGFEVERSLTSTKGGENSWKKLGFVEGNGNSNSPKDYSFVDKSPAGGSKFQYRLRQIDMDGKIEYSNVVEIEVKPMKFELYQNYPNPFNPSTTISFAVPKSGNVTLKIYNTLGEEVATLADGYMEAGIHTMNFNADQLSSGLYIYRLNSKEATFTKKMLFLK